MARNPQAYEEIILDFEDRTELFDEHDVHSAIRHFAAAITEELPKKLLAEMIAFGFAENYQDSDTGWGTYYGPMLVMPNKEGQMVESPSIKLVDAEMLSYWSERANQARHPILKARYADIVWDFSRRVTRSTGDPSMARIAVVAYIDSTQKHLNKHDFDIAKKLNRALSLALSINDEALVQKVKETIISSEAYIAANGNIKNRGFSYDLLIEQHRISLTEDEKHQIIASLEQWLSIVSDAANQELFDPFASEEAALRLAKYYRKINDQNKMREALLKYRDAFLEPSKTASSLVASSWLQKIYTTFRQFSLLKEADEIAVQLRKIGAKSKDEMVTITGEMKISKEQLNSFIDDITEGEMEDALSRIASHFFLNKNEVEGRVKEIAKKTVLSNLVTQEIQDYRGMPIAKIGPLHEDLDGHVVFHMAQNMSFSTVFLRPVIERLCSQFKMTPRDISDYLYKSPIFDKAKLPVIETGLKAFLEGNHMVSAHLLIPQIEDALRNLLEMAGGSVYKPRRSGGLLLKTLDEVLRDDTITQIFGDNIAFYLRVLLTDPRGWNLRNIVCHGMCPAIAFNSDMADRVFHALLLLSHIREKEKSDETSFG